MPYAAPTRCGHRGDTGPCPAIATANGRCEDHQRRPWAQRSKAWGKGGTRQWRALRDKVLRENPECANCGGAAEHVDHIRPLSQGGSKFDHANLQPLCEPCHKAKSMIERRP